MVTISHIALKIINERPMLHDALEEGIVSFGNLAEKLQPLIEEELGKKVKHSAVVMALRRYADKIETMRGPNKTFNFHSEIIMKTNLCDIAVLKSPTIYEKFAKLYALAETDKGDMLNIIQGNNEISVVTNMKHLVSVKKVLGKERVINIDENLVSLSLKYTKEFMYTPGVISTVVRKLTWENVNIMELISTFTELTFIIHKKDAMRGYTALQSLMK